MSTPRSIKVLSLARTWPVAVSIGFAIAQSLLFSQQSISVAYVVSRIEGTVLVFDWGAKIRMIGILIPKPDSLAQAFMRSHVLGTEIDFEVESGGDSEYQSGNSWWYPRIHDRHGIYDLAALLLDSGWAIADVRGDFTRREEYIFREMTARKEGLGIWSGALCVDLRPSDTDFFSLPDTSMTSRKVALASLQSDSSTIILDPSRGVYHVDGCPEIRRGSTRKDRLGAVRRRPDITACATCIK